MTVGNGDLCSLALAKLPVVLYPACCSPILSQTRLRAKVQRCGLHVGLRILCFQPCWKAGSTAPSLGMESSPRLRATSMLIR